jgi:glucose/arabinose dehydrogenase
MAAMRNALAACIAAAPFTLAACGENARRPVSTGIGARPALPEATRADLPTLAIAPACGWPTDGMPTPAAGPVVIAFARGPDHPRLLLVPPDGDVLVAGELYVADTDALLRRASGTRAIAFGR